MAFGRFSLRPSATPLAWPRPSRWAASLALCCLIQPQSCTLAPPGTAKPAAPVCPHIPLPKISKPPLPPVSAFPQILQPGYWQWDDGIYVWTPPVWRARFTTSPPRWKDGYWEANGGACVWHNGHFLPAGAKAVVPVGK